MSDKSNNIELKGEQEVEKFVGIDIYSTSHIPGIHGLYKERYKDFIVKEITENGQILETREDQKSLPFSDSKKDRFTTFNLVKINKDTFEASRIIGKSLKIPFSIIFYSGLKDKRAITVQRISIRGDHVNSLKKLKIRDVFFKSIHPTKSPVKLGSNRGNNFTITIRNIDPVDNLEEIIDELISNLKEKGFPNYFGLQRFGTYRPNSHLIGLSLLKEDYKEGFHEFVTKIYTTESPKVQDVRRELLMDGDLTKAYDSFPKGMNYERNMVKFLIDHPDNFEGTFSTLTLDLKELLISAFQSFFFNKTITLRVKKGYSLTIPGKGDVVSILDEEKGHTTQTKYIYGGNYDKYLDEAIEANRAVIVAPIVGHNSNLDDFPLMKPLFLEVLEEEGIDISIFQSNILLNSNFKGSFRAISTKPIGLKIELLTDDDLFPDKKKFKFEFSLNKGTYATMLLRELMK